MAERHQQLAELLRATQSEIDEALKLLASGEPDSVELVGLLEALALQDQRRAELLNAVKLEASENRRRDEERSIRQFVLRALKEVGTPQTAGYLEDYLYARERVVLKTRGFGALRRDENRAWRRRPGHRRAYIVPCLNADGRPVARWMARSDWPLAERIAVPGVEVLWEWNRVLALSRAWREEKDSLAEALYAPLIERYARAARSAQTEPLPRGVEQAMTAIEAEATAEVDRIGREISGLRTETAKRLATLEPEEQLWGITETSLSSRASSGGVSDADAEQ